MTKAHLQLEDISVSFGGFQAIKGLNLNVKQGELRCLVGPNGAGKTTALDLICGKIKPNTGRLLYKDQDLASMREYQMARAGIGRKFQIPSVFQQLTVRQNLAVARSGPRGFWRNAVQFTTRQSKEKIEELAEFVGLTDQLDQLAETLSHGQTQWLEISLLLAQDSDLILLDEPTAGMTVAETRKTAEICLKLKGKHTLIIVEHDMGFIKEIGDVISVMHQGTMLAEGTVAEIEANAVVREVYLGEEGIADA